MTQSSKRRLPKKTLKKISREILFLKVRGSLRCSKLMLFATRQFQLIIILWMNTRKCKNNPNYNSGDAVERKSDQGQVKISFWHRRVFVCFSLLKFVQNGCRHAYIKEEFWKRSLRVCEEKRLAKSFIVESKIWFKCHLRIFMDFSDTILPGIFESSLEKLQHHKYLECWMWKWLAGICDKRKYWSVKGAILFQIIGYYETFFM